MTKKSKSAFTLAGGERPILNLDFRNRAFTMAEVLITLSIIGVVAALTIPGVVKHHNEKAWATGQDLFIKKLEVALKSMNTQGKLSGYSTTADFVNELKKNIKITKVCTDDVTRCFSSQVRRGKNKGFFTITNTSVEYEAKEGYDWAETVGLQFNNGVTALVAYNKNCYADPYDNQGSVMSSCLGITYDVTANTKPNTVGQDIAYNDNVKPFGCAYEMADGTCFSKILGPNTGYSPLPMIIDNETIYCSTVKNELGIRSCYYGEPKGDPNEKDYWAGAVYACGGRSKLPDKTTLHLLAQELYNDPNIPASAQYGKYGQYGNCSYGGGCTNNFALTTKAAPFLAQSPKGSDASNPSFYVWSSVEQDGVHAYDRYFRSDFTIWGNSYYNRYHYNNLAVCLGD